ncbi:MAG TPA: PA2779 family protein [Burkholderiales bacterium]
MKLTRFRRFVASLLVLCVSATGTLPAYAGIVGTGTVIAGAQPGKLVGVVQRADVQARLQAMGVDPREVEARVAALSDEEAAQLAARLEELPAGGSDVLGVLLIVFLVLLFTDIMGYTKIFPFTRPAK